VEQRGAGEKAEAIHVKHRGRTERPTELIRDKGKKEPELQGEKDLEETHMEGVVKHSVPYRNCTHNGGQSVAERESDVVGSNSYILAKRTYSSPQITNPDRGLLHGSAFGELSRLARRSQLRSRARAMPRFGIGVLSTDRARVGN